LVVLLAWGGLALGQQPPTPVNSGTETYLEITEPGRPPQRCRVLYCWTMEDGKRACQVQAVDTGEIMTIVDPPLPSGAPELVVEQHPPQTLARQVFHWGRNKTCPPGFPIPPGQGAVIVQGPATGQMMAGCTSYSPYMQATIGETGPPPTLTSPGQVVQGDCNLVDIVVQSPAPGTATPRPAFGDRIRSLFGKKTTPD